MHPSACWSTYGILVLQAIVLCVREQEKRLKLNLGKKKHVISLETLTLSHEKLTISNTSKVNREGETQVCIVQLVG